MSKDKQKKKEGKQTNKPTRESKDAEPQLQTLGVITWTFQHEAAVV